MAETNPLLRAWKTVELIRTEGLLSEYKKLEDYYDEDPLHFRKGFVEFCEAHHEAFQEWLKHNPEDDARKAGYLFAANYVALQLDYVLQAAVKEQQEHQEQQQEFKGYLEKLFKI